MDRLLLKLFMVFNPVLAKTGVDIDQLYQIVNIKLLIDRRRPKAQFARKQGSNKATNPVVVDLLLVFFGGFMGFLLFFNRLPLAGQTFYFTMFMVFLAFTLISDFSTVLFDVRDQFILLPRPVNDRTLAVARIFHISIYILRMALLMGLPGIVLAGFAEHSIVAPFVFFIQLIEATFLCILIVNLIYLAMMRVVSPQKFKDVITSFQIAFSVLIFAVYYLLPRLIDISVLEKLNLLDLWWARLLPPMWIAAVGEIIVHPGRANIITVILALIGLLLPLAGLWFVAKVLAPGFNKRLAVLATSDGVAQPVTKKVNKTDFRDRIANLLCSDSVENAGFRITWKMAARTREFKMRVFPSFAYVPFYFVFIALQGKGHQTLSEKVEHIQAGSSYIFLIYVCTIVLSQILGNVSQTEKYKSAWVYYALPIGQPGKVLSGMYKAVLSLYFFPYCLLISIATICVWGPKVINDLVLAFLICSIYGLLMSLFMVNGPPFSKPVANKQAGGKFMVSIMIMTFIGALGFGHYWLTRFETLIWILIIPAAAVLWILMYYYRRQSWESIEFSDVEPIAAPVKVKKSWFAKRNETDIAAN